jgi:hypothetical protein
MRLPQKNDLKLRRGGLAAGGGAIGGVAGVVALAAVGVSAMTWAPGRGQFVRSMRRGWRSAAAS